MVVLILVNERAVQKVFEMNFTENSQFIAYAIYRYIISDMVLS